MTDDQTFNERLLLCRCMLDRDGILHSYGYRFADPRNRAVGRAIEALLRDGEPTDLISIADRLERDGDLDAAGGVAYLTDLLNSCGPARDEFGRGRLRLVTPGGGRP